MTALSSTRHSIVLASLVSALLLVLTSFGTPPRALAATSHTLASPDGRITVRVDQSASGALTYAVTAGGQAIVSASPLGLTANGIAFGTGLSLQSEARRSLDSTYSLPAGTKPSYRDHANELTLTYTKSGVTMRLVYRAYDDGIGFRYEFPGVSSISVSSEDSGFRFPTGTGGWAAPWAHNYEQDYTYRSASALNSGENLTFPLLASINNNRWFALVSEAGVLQNDGAFHPSLLRGSSDGVLRVMKTPDMTATHSAPGPFVTPWRTMTVADTYTRLLNSDLVQNLNPAPAAGDLSWIAPPARASWSWFADPDSAASVPLQKQYIDWAASMGFEAHTLDCCYNNDDLPELSAYARQRGIKLWVWVTAAELSTPEKAEAWASRLAAAGVSGLKVDFFLNDSQAVTRWYSVIADAARRHKLMLLFHGSTKPSGENRTWPWLVSNEAVAGTEHYMYEPKPSARLDATLPFVRGPLGSMDYTPTMISRNDAVFTQAHVLAQSIVLDSALINYADSDAAYEQFPGRHLMRAVPARYDETRVVEGFPGDHITMARRAGSDWYLGAFTVKARTSSVPLAFLGDGTYTATIFEDDAYGRLKVRTQQVTRSSVLSLPMIATGGYAVHLSTTPLTLSGQGDTRYEAENATLGGTAKPAACRGCSTGWSATGLGYSGTASFTNVTVPQAGTYTLTYTYTGYQQRAFQVAVNGQVVQTTPPISSGGWESVAKRSVTVALKAGANVVTFSNPNGWANDLDALVVSRQYQGEDGALTKASVANCSQCVGGRGAALTAGGTVSWSNVAASTGGNKTVRLGYTSATGGWVRVASGGQSVRTYLPPSGGAELLSTRSVGLPLAAGLNTVTVTSESGTLTIDEAAVTA